MDLFCLFRLYIYIVHIGSKIITAMKQKTSLLSGYNKEQLVHLYTFLLPLCTSLLSGYNKEKLVHLYKSLLQLCTKHCRNKCVSLLSLFRFPQRLIVYTILFVCQNTFFTHTKGLNTAINLYKQSYFIQCRKVQFFFLFSE